MSIFYSIIINEISNAPFVKLHIFKDSSIKLKVSLDNVFSPFWFKIEISLLSLVVENKFSNSIIFSFRSRSSIFLS